MTEGARSDGRPPHGSIADEVVKLAEVAQVWLSARSSSSARDRAQDVWAAATASGGEEPSECQGCLYCRGRRAVAQAEPAVLAHLADAAGSLAAALRAMGREGGRS